MFLGEFAYALQTLRTADVVDIRADLVPIGDVDDDRRTGF